MLLKELNKFSYILSSKNKIVFFNKCFSSFQIFINSRVCWKTCKNWGVRKFHCILQWQRRTGSRAKAPVITCSAIFQRLEKTASAILIIPIVRNSHLYFDRCVVMWSVVSVVCFCFVVNSVIVKWRCRKKGRGGYHRFLIRWRGSVTTAARGVRLARLTVHT